MIRSLSVILLFFCLITSNILMVAGVESIQNGFTHSILCERFSNTQSYACINEQDNIQEIEKEAGHSLHLIDFHLQDDWSTIEATERAVEFNVTMVPSYVFDGGHEVGMGEPLKREIIENIGTRITHKISLSIDKKINGQELEIECTVIERNGFQLTGEIVVYIVENHLKSNSIEWNNVFRGYAMRERFELKPNAHEIFYGSWSIPEDVNSENLKVIAAVLDISENRDPHYIQSICDEEEKLDVPEFSNPVLVLILINLIAVVLIRRVIKRNEFIMGI